MNLKMALFIVESLMFLSSFAHGDDVKIAVRTGQNCNGFSCTTQWAYGSGVTIGTLRDGRQAVLTCSHVVRDGERVLIYWYDNARVEAQVLLDGNRDGMDVALLAAKLPGNHDCNPLMAQPPAVDQSVMISGYPGGSGCVRVRGSLFGRRLVVKAHAISQGMSGGAVRCGDDLAGIVWGYEVNAPTNGAYTPSWLIAPWLKQRLGYVPECCASPTHVDGTPKPAPEPPNDTATETEILARLQRLEKALAGLASSVPTGLPGPRGPAGVQGERGVQGPMGPQGPAGSVDARQVEALAAELAAIKAEKITVRITSEGKVIDEDTYPRTGPIVLDFAPIKAKSK